MTTSFTVTSDMVDCKEYGTGYDCKLNGKSPKTLCTEFPVPGSVALCSFYINVTELPRIPLPEFNRQYWDH
jgi:hypothetical protein